MKGLNKESVWHEVLESLKVSVSPPVFSTWISQTHLVSLKKLDKSRYLAEVGCASSYVKATVERRYFGLTQDAIIKAIGSPCDISFTVKALAQNTVVPKESFAPLFEEKTQTEEVIQKIGNANLRLGFTFKNFAVSGSNQMAHAAAEAVSNQPGTAYNPLFFWGGVGVGKTHLMHSVGHKLINENVEVKILACTGEDFTNDIVEGIRNKTTQSFRNKYRRLNCLLIDDIQFIAGKDTVQEEFFHTFNAVTAAGGQIIMTSDTPPSDIPKLEERLRSRFEAGLIVDIANPDYELRCAIIYIKSGEKGVDLTETEVQLIASNFESARTIEGFLTRLSSESKLKTVPITNELVKTLIGKGMKDDDLRKRISPEEVIDAVCTHYSIGKRAILGKGRTKLIAQPRQILMYILRKELGLPLEEVGRIIGGRDHTTIMHGVEKITQLTADNVDIRDDIMRIKRFL